MPMNLWEEAIALCHNLHFTGHQGVERTKERVKEKFGLSSDVKRYVTQYVVCNQNKKVNRQCKFAVTDTDGKSSY